MLIYKKEDLPDDLVFPEDLEKLAFFINDQDQIRQIADPNEGFRYRINRNERWNEIHCTAFNECIQRIVISRLTDLGLSTLRLPLGARPDEKHVPILCSSNLGTASRIILVLGSPDQELGIWTYRSIAERSIDTGSMVNITKAVLGMKDKDSEEGEKHNDTALVIANTGQLVYHCGSGKAMSQRTWLTLPVESAVHPPLKQTYRNVIPRNTNWREHVKCIFEDILAPASKMVIPKAKIDIIGVEEGGLAAAEYLTDNWEVWKERISAMCFARPVHQIQQLRAEVPREQQHTSLKDDGGDFESSSGAFEKFMATRCRAYVLSDKPLEWPVPGTPEYGCNTYSSGEAVNHEDVIVSSWRNMLLWLDKLHQDSSYEEVKFIIKEELDDDEFVEGWAKWQRGDEDAVMDMTSVSV